MIDRFEWPWCAKCQHGVEKVKRELDFFTGDIIYTVYCHGQTQTQRVVGIDLHDVDLIQVTSCFDETPTDAYPSVTYVRSN